MSEDNLREGMILYGIWLNPEEEKLLLESLKKGVNSVAWTVIKTAYDRGDLNKK